MKIVKRRNGKLLITIPANSHNAEAAGKILEDIHKIIEDIPKAIPDNILKLKVSFRISVENKTTRIIDPTN